MSFWKRFLSRKPADPAEPTKLIWHASDYKAVLWSYHLSVSSGPQVGSQGEVVCKTVETGIVRTCASMHEAICYCIRDLGQSLIKTTERGGKCRALMLVKHDLSADRLAELGSVAIDDNQILETYNVSATDLKKADPPLAFSWPLSLHIDASLGPHVKLHEFQRVRIDRRIAASNLPMGIGLSGDSRVWACVHAENNGEHRPGMRFLVTREANGWRLQFLHDNGSLRDVIFPAQTLWEAWDRVIDLQRMTVLSGSRSSNGPRISLVCDVTSQHQITPLASLFMMHDCLCEERFVQYPLEPDIR